MKKTITILAAIATLGVASAFAQDASSTKTSTSTASKSAQSMNGKSQGTQDQYTNIGELSAVGDFRVASEDVFRGKKLAGFAVQPMVKLGYPVWEGELYGSTFFSLPVDEGPASLGGPSVGGGANLDNAVFGASNRDRADFTFGYNMPVTDMFSIDFGYTYHWYIQHNVWGVDRSNEIYLGATANVMLDPTAYIYYDWDLEQFVFQADVSYSFNLTQYTGDFGVGGLSLDLGAYVGWLFADAYNSDRRPVNGAGNPFGATAGTKAPKWENGYTYGGLKADLVFALNDVAKASFGMHWAANNDGKDGLHQAGSATFVPANQGNHESMLWWEAAVTFSF
tara:strand:- start:6809 stop:7819 length:1011 start_codon:yes stop_codon:yes gene_type:complete